MLKSNLRTSEVDKIWNVCFRFPRLSAVFFYLNSHLNVFEKNVKECTKKEIINKRTLQCQGRNAIDYCDIT